VLLPLEQDAWNCAYALGACALSAFTESNEMELDVLDIKASMSQQLNKDLSMNQVVLALGWLFLIEKVKQADNGKIQLC
jgi:hypothetical protein